MASTSRDLEHKGMSLWVYDFILWILSVIIDLFFREIHPRSSWKIPRKGPVIFVAAPHANQFVDPLILMRVIRLEARRRAAILIAEKSVKRRFVGTMSRAMGALSVGRALDQTTSAPGRISLPDPDNDPTLLRGVGTNFKSAEFQIGGLVVLPSVNNVAANSEIVEIHGPEELRVKNPFKGDIALQQLTGRKLAATQGDDDRPAAHEQIERSRNDDGTKFKVAPKVDQTKVYDEVFDKLSRGGCIGIYPEGGSHDRTELLPLKAGVAIMALGAVAANPDCDLKIVPCGMNYFHAHKFRSRAVIEFGTPLVVPEDLVEEYRHGSRREAIGQMLHIIYDALVAVTVTSPDYDTLMLIQAVRRLYNPKGKRLPLPMVVELNRRLVKGYTHYRDDPRIIRLKKNVLDYNKSLMALNVRDHQIAYAKLSFLQVTGALIYRLGKLALLSLGVLPGLFLFAPIFIAGKLISIKKSKEALAASTVKIQARDVVATWKLLVSMALAPALYATYTIALCFWTRYNRFQGIVPSYVPIWVVAIASFIVMPMVTFAALRFGEIGMDIAKSLRPLVLCLNPSSGNTLVKLRKRREDLSGEVTDLINTLGPELFPDFEAQRIVQDTRPKTPVGHTRSRSWNELNIFRSRGESPDGREPTTKASLGGGSSMAGILPRNESFRNLANFGFFASRPGTPSSDRSHSRPSSRPASRNGFTFGGAELGMSKMEATVEMDDVSRRIRGAMQERGKKRASQAADGVDEDSDGEKSSSVSTPASTDGLAMKKQQ